MLDESQSPEKAGERIVAPLVQSILFALPAISLGGDIDPQGPLETGFRALFLAAITLPPLPVLPFESLRSASTYPDRVIQTRAGALNVATSSAQMCCIPL